MVATACASVKESAVQIGYGERNRRCNNYNSMGSARGEWLVQSETYRGYSVWGHAIPQQEDVLLPERYAASGTITRNNKVVEASGVLGVFDSEQEAQLAGLDWACAGRQSQVSCTHEHAFLRPQRLPF